MDRDFCINSMVAHVGNIRGRDIYACISYRDSTNGELRYATNKRGSWVYATLDFTGNVGMYTSIAFDSSNNVHISYFDNTNGDLKYVRIDFLQ